MGRDQADCWANRTRGSTNRIDGVGVGIGRRRSPERIEVSGQDLRAIKKSSIAIQSPRLKTQRLFAINRAELFLFDGQRFAMEV